MAAEEEGVAVEALLDRGEGMAVAVDIGAQSLVVPVERRVEAATVLVVAVMGLVEEAVEGVEAPTASEQLGAQLGAVEEAERGVRATWEAAWAVSTSHMTSCTARPSGTPGRMMAPQCSCSCHWCTSHHRCTPADRSSPGACSG